MNKSKSKTQKHRKTQKYEKRRINKKQGKTKRRYMKGGSFSMPIGKVIPFNNYLEDPQRAIESARNIL